MSSSRSSDKCKGNHHRWQHPIVYFMVALLCVTRWVEPCLAFTAFAPTSMLVRSRDLADRTIAHSKAADGDTEILVVEQEEDVFENVAAAVFVPGFLTGAAEFEPICRALTERGIPTVAAPMPNWHWLPCLGGRSARPILERIDFAVKHLVANLETKDNAILSDKRNAVLNIPRYDYSLWDCYKEFRENPGGVLQVGGAASVEEYPVVEPRGYFPQPKGLRQNGAPKKKIALIGHSAGGWISRVYLSSAEYGGRMYGGSDYVHTLITLGTPHSNAPGPAFDGIRWINDSNRETDRLTKVRSLSVAGTGFKGDQWGDLTLGAYGFCASEGTDNPAEYDGDGVTPVFSALGMPGSESMTLENVSHFCWSDVFGGDLVAPELTEDHKNGKPWYGSEGIIDQWASFILEAASKTTTNSNAATPTTKASAAKIPASEATLPEQTAPQ